MVKQPNRLEALSTDLQSTQRFLEKRAEIGTKNAAIGVGLVAIARAITEIAIQVAKSEEMIKFTGSDRKES